MKKPYTSRFKEGPKTKIGKWAFWLSVVAVMSGPILGISAAIFVPFIDDNFGDTVSAVIGSSVAISVVLLFIVGLVLSIIAFVKRERSWAVWAALVISSLVACFWIMMILGEFLSPH